MGKGAELPARVHAGDGGETEKGVSKAITCTDRRNVARWLAREQAERNQVDVQMMTTTAHERSFAAARTSSNLARGPSPA
eukprot:scaffold1768_cov116-Isochrysis_galbana.AAC.6